MNICIIPVDDHASIVRDDGTSFCLGHSYLGRKWCHAYSQEKFSCSMAFYLTTPTQLFLYSCHEWPVGQSKNLYGDIIPSLAKLAWGFSVVCNHHKLVAVASYYLNIVGIIYQVLFMIYLCKHSTSIEWGRRYTPFLEFGTPHLLLWGWGHHLPHHSHRLSHQSCANKVNSSTVDLTLGQSPDQRVRGRAFG